jgi:predicted nucleic acid-binding protein
LRSYLDSSAILKLIFVEKESKALISSWPEFRYTSALSRVDVIRAVQLANPAQLEAAQLVLGSLNFIQANDEVIRTAELFSPQITLRTLDAIHLASALYLGSKLDNVITYDAGMAKAAKALGLTVLAPA